MNLFELSMLRIIRNTLEDYPTLVSNVNLSGTEAMYYLCYWNLTKKYNPARIETDKGSYYVLMGRKREVVDVNQVCIYNNASVHTMPFPTTNKPSKDAMLLINKVLER